MNDRAFPRKNGFFFFVTKTARASLLGASLVAASLAGGCAAPSADDALAQGDQEEQEALDEESDVLEARVVGTSRDSRDGRDSNSSRANPRVVGVSRDSHPTSSRGGVGKVTRTEHDTSSRSRSSSNGNNGRTVHWGSSSRR